jgi:isopenicillin N synthase-like dioxygenase
MADVPIVDLARPLDEVASTIRDACVRHGFFFVVNHGVARDVVDAMFAASSDFFSLPDDAKRTVVQDENNRGWTPHGEETLDPKHQTTGDSKEGYYIGRECEDDEIGLPLRGKNRWPDESSLGLRAFRAPMTAYYDACASLARRVMPALATALGLASSFFDDKFTRPTALLRPLRYAATASDPAAGVFAAGAHSDYGVLTILATDGTPGLQIHDARAAAAAAASASASASASGGSEEAWVPVPAVADAFVCNVGDLCERWTNGVFKSTRHRVVTTGAGVRLSAAFFWEPNFETDVSPLRECVSEENPARFEPTTYGAYILGKYAETHSGFDARTQRISYSE